MSRLKDSSKFWAKAQLFLLFHCPWLKPTAMKRLVYLGFSQTDFRRAWGFAFFISFNFIITFSNAQIFSFDNYSVVD